MNKKIVFIFFIISLTHIRLVYSQRVLFDTYTNFFQKNENCIHTWENNNQIISIGSSIDFNSTDSNKYYFFYYRLDSNGKLIPNSFTPINYGAISTNFITNKDNFVFLLLRNTKPSSGPFIYDYKLLHFDPKSITFSSINLEPIDINQLLRIALINNDTIFCAGNSSIYDKADFRLSYFDKNGGQILSKSFFDSWGNPLKRLPFDIKGSNGKILVCGSSFDSSVYKNGNIIYDRSRFPWAALFDSKGERIWSINFSSSFYSYFENMETPYKYGSYFAKGYFSNSNEIFLIGNGNNQPLLVKLDMDGKLLWSKKYFNDSSNFATFFSALEIDDFLFIIGTSKGFNWMPIKDVSYSDNIPFVAKIDKKNGDLIGIKFYDYFVNRSFGNYIKSDIYSISKASKGLIFSGYSFPDPDYYQGGRIIYSDFNGGINGIENPKSIKGNFDFTVFPNPFTSSISLQLLKNWNSSYSISISNN